MGKTETTLRLAEHFGVPVINADSRQIFAEIPIGTAAPTAAQQARVRHYFVGNHHLEDYYSASLFEEDVLKLINESSSKVSLLSGGSMMYIDAVCKGIDDIKRTFFDGIRTERCVGSTRLFTYLKGMDNTPRIALIDYSPVFWIPFMKQLAHLC